ncbi:PREDICTED: uncharacterized protein LOC105570063 [Vollenhovia emeryi]|uniref:uncharacterized protein LOC105570063 n=1 Tax=Vollenhovia emeryi TaxID=411798 RepID=UPI0005F41EB5|nr:PREDICTED: uncharacterized protein LOC105570063 [Vollenhovia emeryi]
MALLVKRQLGLVIRRFKFEELEDAVLPAFPEISWTRVKSKLIKNHKNFTALQVARILEEVLDNVELREKDLRDRLATLEVIDVSRHDKRKIWYGYELTSSSDAPRYVEQREVQSRIEEEFHTSGLQVMVKTATHDNVTFIYVKETRKKRAPRQRTTPTFFALFLGHKYFFCSKKNVLSGYVKAIAASLGCDNGKKIKLSGKDLRSLIKLLWIRQQNVLHIENISQPPVYQPSSPVVSKNGVDYTQSKQRRSYGEQCLGENPPTLDVLVIKAPEQSVYHDSVASKLSTDSIRMNWEFNSRNLARFLIVLIEKGAFTLPLPEYVSNLMTRGRNELTLCQINQ